MSWVDSLSLEALYRAGTRTEGRHALIMLGLSQAMWHLEMVEDANGEMPPSSTDEDLLVLYVGGPIDDDAVGRSSRPGGLRVAARNLHRDRWGVTIMHPDGPRLVLSHRPPPWPVRRRRRHPFSWLL